MTPLDSPRESKSNSGGPETHDDDNELGSVDAQDELKKISLEIQSNRGGKGNEILISKLKKIFPDMELSRTLNSIETVAKGCALQAAMLSPNFRVQNFEVEEYNPLNVQI